MSKAGQTPGFVPTTVLGPQKIAELPYRFPLCQGGCTRYSPSQRLAQPVNLTVVRQLLQAQPTPTRTQLARELCRRLELRDAKGDWQVATTAHALRDLAAQGHWTLPAPRVQRTGTYSTPPKRLPSGPPERTTSNSATKG